MGHYRKRPVVIEAFQWDGGDNTEELLEWTVEQGATPDDPVIQVDRLGEYRNVHFIKLYVAANDEWLEIEPNEWVIKDKLGFYPCKDEIFQENYEAVTVITVEHNDDTISHGLFDPSISVLTESPLSTPPSCEYGSCDMPKIHLGPHRCAGCHRPCDDPELNCDIHASGWPS